MACPLLPGFPPPLLSSISTLSTLQVSVVVPSGSLLRYCVESSRCGPPSGLGLSQSSIGTKALPPPFWCLVGVFAMRSPWRVEFVSDLDRNEDSSRTFLTGWCRAFAMGSPVLGRVAYFCALDQNEGFFFPSILSCFAMGSPYGSSMVFLHSITMKSSLVIWSVFLQDGVTLFVSGSKDLLSSEGIPTVGFLGAFFRTVLGRVFVILWSAGRLWRGEGSTFSCLRFWRGLCVCPSSQRRSGSWPFFFLWPCCPSPSPDGSACFGGLFYLWWRLPPWLVSLGGPLLWPPAVSSGLHRVGVVRRAFPSPGPLWRRLRIFCFGSAARRGFAFPPSGAIAWCCLIISPCPSALLCSFRVSSPSRAVRPPSWALAVFLRHLSSSSFVLLRSAPLRSLLQMVLFFVALATAIPMGELQALSRCFSFVRGSTCLSFVHTFVAKCESLPLGCISVRLCGWSRRMSFALLSSCPPHFPGQDGFRAVSPCRLFVSPRCPSRALSVATVLFLLRVVFMQPLLPGLRLAPFARMSSVASPPL